MTSSAKRWTVAAALYLSTVATAFGQQTVVPTGMPSVAAVTDSLPIIPGDLLNVHVLEIPDLDQPHVRVTDSGEIPLLLLGSVKVGGLTPGQAAQFIATTYMDRHYLRNAHIAVTVEEFSSSTVTVFGYVNGPAGISTSTPTMGSSIPLTTPRPLLTVLSMAGGLTDRASRTITIQRRDTSIKPFTVSVPNDATVDLANNPLINPGDIVIVPRAGIVYVLGDVGSPKGVVMQEDGEISLMQALSQAGSTLPTAKLSKLMVFRRVDGQYQSIPIDLAAMVKGKIPDPKLRAEDVVWVPFSFGKNILLNGAAIVSALGSATASGIIYTH